MGNGVIFSEYLFTRYVKLIVMIGIGTIIAAFLASDKNDLISNLIIGIAQLLTSVILVGWIWSIIWGYFIWKRGSGYMKYLPDAII